MSDKKVSQLTEQNSLNTGFYFYTFDSSDSTQYKTPQFSLKSSMGIELTGLVLNERINSLSGYVNIIASDLTSTGNYLQNEIDSIKNNTGSFITRKITGLYDTNNVERLMFHTTGTTLYNQSHIPILVGTTNVTNFYINNQKKMILTAASTLLLDASNVQYFLNSASSVTMGDFSSSFFGNKFFIDYENDINYLTNDALNVKLGINNLTPLYNLDVVGNGNFSQGIYDNGINITGKYYSRDNPSGYIINGNSTLGTSLGELILYNNNGSFNGLVFLPNNDPVVDEFYVRSRNNDAFIDINGNTYVQTSIPRISGFDIYAKSLYLSGASLVTGQVIRPSDTGQFYPRIGNPSGFVTGQVVRPSQTGNFLTKNGTGLFDTAGIHRLKFLPTETSLYDNVASPRIIANDNGTYIYDNGNVIRYSTSTTSESKFYNSEGLSFLNDLGFNGNYEVILGDYENNFGGTKFTVSPVSNNAYLTNINNTDAKLGINTSNPLYSLDIIGSQNTTQTGFFGFTALTGIQNTLLNAPANKSIEYLLVSGSTRQVRFAYNSGGLQYTGAVNLI